MLFNSLIFLLFALVFFTLWHFIKKGTNNLRWLFLVLASFFFYGWWDWRFLFLIIGSGLIDFIAGLGIARFPKQKTAWLIASLLANLGSLTVFKYSSFFANNLEILFSWFGLSIDLSSRLPEFVLILPVGISFYTFQSMSYTIDIYRNQLTPTKNILHFFAYLSMFPQLVAGPIVRAKDFLAQLKKPRKVGELERWNGAKLIVIGFFKKVVLADNIAPMVNAAFIDSDPSHSTIYWWGIMTAFAFQIYFDFSGYSDIARGLAKWMGFHFKVNFNHPYIATSIRDFWTRWHISLSTWFRDYVYIPLGGSKKGKLRGHLNMWITMLVSGFWHGASFNFVIWGGLHALYLSLERIFKLPRLLKKLFLGKYLAWAFLMAQVLIAWVFFRATSFSQAFQIVGDMLSFNFSESFAPLFTYANAVIFLAIAVVIEGFFLLGIQPKRWFSKDVYFYLEVVYVALLIVACVFLRGEGQQFIYFQF